MYISLWQLLGDRGKIGNFWGLVKAPSVEKLAKFSHQTSGFLSETLFGFSSLTLSRIAIAQWLFPSGNAVKNEVSRPLH